MMVNNGKEHKNIKEWTDILPSMNKILLNNLKKSKYQYPTPIQQKTIPILTSNKDVNVKALTGSGKTLAFLISAISILLNEREEWIPHQIGALILTPTRELAQQVYNVLQEIIENIPLKSMLLIGGNDFNGDINKFEENGSNIIIATPGRLEAILELSVKNSKTSFSSYLRHLEVLIFDEADRLLDMGFAESISFILKYIPKQRRTGLFSATSSEKLGDLLKAGLRHPVDISLNDYDQQEHIEIDIPSTLINYYNMCDVSNKFDFLLNFLDTNKSKKILLFFATTNCVDYFGGTIKRLFKGVSIFLLHGKIKKRSSMTLDNFSKSSSGILICSDLLARGIDIPDIDWVIQFEPPNNVKTYIHRIGRTARYGGIGKSLILLTPDQDTYIHFLNINQKIVLKNFSENYTIAPKFNNVSQMMRDYSLTDRDMYIKGIKAYVSYVRFYQEHQLKHIFSIKDLDLCKLATLFGLLHLPNMPELKKINKNNFDAIIMDYDKIPFKDRNREKERQKYLLKSKLAIKDMDNENNTEYKKSNKLKRSKNRNTQNKLLSKRHKLSENDLMELDDDNRFLKKFKKNKLSKDVLKNIFE